MIHKSSSFMNFHVFAIDMAKGVHRLWGEASGDFTDHTLKAMLVNTKPSRCCQTKAELIEIIAGNGYDLGGHDISAKASQSDDGFILTGRSFHIVATGGTIGPFRSVVIYNETAPSHPLVCAWNYGAEVMLKEHRSFAVTFNGAPVGEYGEILSINHIQTKGTARLWSSLMRRFTTS